MNRSVTATLALALLLLGGCSVDGKRATNALERVRRTGILRWGGDLAGGEPYVYEDPAHSGQLLGFEADLASAIARELGVRAEFQQNEWSQLIPSLERGGFDVILNGFEATPRNAARVMLTRPYYEFAERLTVRHDNPRFSSAIAAQARLPNAGTPAHFDLSSLAHLRVGTLAGSLAADLLRDAGVTDVLLYDGVDTPYSDLVLGRSDAVLLDDLVADRYGAVHKELATAADVAPGYYAAAVSLREPELAAAVDQALGTLARSDELRRILETYRLWSDREQPLLNWSRAPGNAADQTLFHGATQQSGASAITTNAPLSVHDIALFLKGAAYTVLVSVSSMALAVPLGLLLAVARLYGGRGARAVAAAYVELYRGTPVLLQLYLLYFGLADFVRLGPVEAAVLGLGMNYAAYEAEVYRGAMNAVPRGQLEAAFSLGMTLPQALRRVLLPQALRVALPSVTNDFIALLKDSSLVSVITVVELTKRSQIVAIETRSWLLPGLLCAALYFAMSYPLSLLARRLDTRLARA